MSETLAAKLDALVSGARSTAKRKHLQEVFRLIELAAEQGNLDEVAVILSATNIARVLKADDLKLFATVMQILRRMRARPTTTPEGAEA